MTCTLNPDYYYIQRTVNFRHPEFRVEASKADVRNGKVQFNMAFKKHK